MAQSAVPQDTDLTYDVPCRRIQVSREKRPLNFFVTLSKKFLTTDDVVELSGLGLAVTTVVTIAEILKSSGFVSLERKSRTDFFFCTVRFELFLWRC